MEDTRVLVEEESTSKPSEQEISPQKIDQKIQEKISSETDHQGPKPKKETKKGKKKTKSEKTSSADHGENEDDDDKADMGDMGTLFILDLMRQKREKLMRQKKDEKINEMAMKKVRPHVLTTLLSPPLLPKGEFTNYVNRVLGNKMAHNGGGRCKKSQNLVHIVCECPLKVLTSNCKSFPV